MRKKYFTSNHRKVKSLPLKQSVLTLFFMLSVTLVFGQLRIETISSHSDWVLQYANSGGPLTWNTTGAVVDTQIGVNTVSFDFSTNTSNANIFVESTADQGALNKITIFIANGIFPLPTSPVSFEGQKISFIDVTDLENLQSLILDYNNLTSIDVSQNPDLENLSLINNIGITSLDVSKNTKLKELKMEGTSLTSAEIDNILNTVERTSKEDGGFIDFSNISTGRVTANGIQAYINLTARGWVIIPPIGFDVGDAPDSYATSIANNGPVHIYDELNIVLRLGVFKDSDFKTAISPGVNADGDDNDNVNDEDGVDISQFDNLNTTATSLSIDVELVNNYSEESYLHAWIDFDRNGAFEVDEYAAIVVPANTSGTQSLNWDIAALGADINYGQSYTRFRYTSDNNLDATSIGGIVNGGEVEDYAIHIQGDPTIELEKSEFEEHLGLDEISQIFFVFNDNTPHTFSLVDGSGGSDNGDFSISGNILSKKIIFDYENKKEYFIRIKGEDKDGFSVEKSFIIKVTNINDIVISGNVTNNICGNGLLGAVETSIQGYISPLSIKWSSGETSQNISGKASGNYTITITDAVGMEKSKEFVISTVPIYNNLNICHVTSDEFNSNFNRIYLNNDGAYNVGKFEILRESSVSGVYDKIAEINENEGSYLDVTSDSQSISYKYKVRVKDLCGELSDLSVAHKTILLQANKAADGSINLNWNHYEGMNFGTYDIYRKEKQNNSEFELLISLSSSNNSYNDTQANANTKSYDYYIAIKLIDPCKFTPEGIINKQIRSNTKTIETALGIEDDILTESVKLIPNPVSDFLNVKSDLVQLKKVEFYSLLGQKVIEVKDDFNSIDLNDLSRGIYLIKIYSEKGSSTFKLIKK